MCVCATQIERAFKYVRLRERGTLRRGEFIVAQMGRLKCRIKAEQSRRETWMHQGMNEKSGPKGQGL